MLFTLVALTVVLGIYPSLLTDGLHNSVSSLIYQASSNVSLSFSLIVFAPHAISAERLNKTANKSVICNISFPLPFILLSPCV